MSNMLVSTGDRGRSSAKPAEGALGLGARSASPLILFTVKT